MKYILFLFGFLIAALSYSQVGPDTTSSPATPIGGIERLALRYYDIEFTPEQRKLIEGVKLELIFLVSDEGVATLESVNGVRNRAILDSLYSRDPFLPGFIPEIRKGIPKQSLYFIQFIFPTYSLERADVYQQQLIFYKPPTLEDFESLEMSNQRLDIIFGGMANSFFGSAADYLSPGGGMKVEMSFTTENLMFYGFNMNFFGNKRIQDYDLSSPLPQFSHPPTLFLGATVGRWFGVYNLQLDLNYAIQNITERLEDDDSDWVQFRGFSPGVVLHRVLQLGKDRFQANSSYGRPIFVAHCLNFSLGLRYLKMSQNSASGFMAEVGVSYRLATKLIESYRLKDSYFE